MISINRKFERRMVLVASSWQVISGVITSFIYAPTISNNSTYLEELSEFDVVSAQILLKNVYIVSFTIGLFFIVFGFVNFFISTRMKDDQIDKKISVWFLIYSVICFFMMDIFSMIIFFVTAIIMFSKNKVIKQKYKQQLLK